MNSYERIFNFLTEKQSSSKIAVLADRCAKKIKAKGCKKALQKPKAKKDRISLLKSKGKLKGSPTR
jgi:hypothetical protein